MLIRRAPDFRYSEITPKSLYLNRRAFLAGLPVAFAGVRGLLAGTRLNAGKSPLSTTGEKLNTYQQVSTYNNYYEFGIDKDAPAVNAREFRTSPWTVKVEGDCAKPRSFSLEEIMTLAPLEERVYRHRCVEAWSIVVPWIGYSLSELLKKVEPTSKARYVAFETFWDRRQMPHAEGLNFPYVEGLRMDEAMHPLTMLSVGMFGETLPAQDGAPVRLTVPWKYGFKSIKSIVKIKLQGGMPRTSWNDANPTEYGFYSNVNPGVDHPRWSQKMERRLGEFGKRQTLMFNGYGEQVASLYNGMNLKSNY
jgi:methionine sulfoxide reductase catalytic subunit